MHEGNSAGTRMYWLKKLVTFKINGDNINTELDCLEVLSEQLSSLVSSKRPLTVNEITCMVVCLSLPVSFKPITASLLQRDSISSSVLLSAVREELTRTSIHSTSSSRQESVSVASEKRRDDRPPCLFCYYCCQAGHQKDKCPSLEVKRKDQDELTKLCEDLD